MESNLQQVIPLESFMRSFFGSLFLNFCLFQTRTAMKEALLEETSSSMSFPLFFMGSMKSDSEHERTAASSCGPPGHSSQSLRECLQLQEQLDSSQPQVTETEPNFHDHLFYIFTSGTTGLPKATITKHSRLSKNSHNVHKHCILTVSLLNPQLQVHGRLRCNAEHELSEI